MRNNTLPIAKEGWRYIGCAFASSVLFYMFDFELLGFLALLAVAFLVFVFRNPKRESLGFSQGAVISPVDGVVLSVDELKDDAEYGYIVQVQSGYKDVALLRVPLDGKVESVEFWHGSRVSRFSHLFEKLNEKAELMFSSQNGDKIKVVHILSRSVTPLSIGISPKQTLTQGMRYALMTKGITYMYIPDNFRINISKGSRLLASQSLIGYFSH